MNYSPPAFKNEKVLIILLSSIPILLHLYTNAFAGYGIFRDELYYIACSKSLDLGYVDQPPLSIYILSLNRLLFGDSVFALRLLPAVNSALTVLFTCLMTITMASRSSMPSPAGKAAVIIAGTASIFAPVYLGMHGFYSMNSFDILLWTVAFYIIILIIENNTTSCWILPGFILGLGLLNKISFLWLCFGFFLGILITDKRKVLLTYKPYVCALIALLIFTPYIIWNFNHDFAHIEFIRNATKGKYSNLNAEDFLKGQILNMNPVSLLVSLPGLYYFMIDKSGKQFRILGIIFITTFLILILNSHSKAEYLSPAYTALFAGGGVFIERITALKFRWLRYALVSAIVIMGLIITPLALPILPVESYIKYADKLGFAPSTSENNKLSELPQHFADMFGWEELAKNVSEVYLSIPENERKNVLFFGNNYGEAGAVEYFSRKYPLPDAISTHNNYWLWGYGNKIDPVVIILGGDKEDHLRVFEEVQEVGLHTAKYSMPYENNLPIFIARKLKVDINNVWKRNKNYS